MKNTAIPKLSRPYAEGKGHIQAPEPRKAGLDLDEGFSRLTNRKRQRATSRSVEITECHIRE